MLCPSLPRTGSK
uniref:Uncharacterized protein n=1 Tax=Arundo donax TaxID=35708 RepID=A0A0A9HBE8_ARUDO